MVFLIWSVDSFACWLVLRCLVGWFCVVVDLGCVLWADRLFLSCFTVLRVIVGLCI